MKSIVHPQVKTGADVGMTLNRKPLMAELENYSEKQRVVIKTCRHLVKHKYRELLEWCQRVKTDKVEVMATLTDVRLFSEGMTMPEFVETAKSLKNTPTKSSGCFSFIPIMDACQIKDMPTILTICFSWEVFNWLAE